MLKNHSKEPGLNLKHGGETQSMEQTGRQCCIQDLKDWTCAA